MRKREEGADCGENDGLGRGEGDCEENGGGG